MFPKISFSPLQCAQGQALRSFFKEINSSKSSSNLKTPKFGNQIGANIDNNFVFECNNESHYYFIIMLIIIMIKHIIIIYCIC